MLDTAARFHHYSANNVFLIMVQRPDATRIAGYRTWQSRGRQVRKGEHGITILAPCRYKVETDDGEDSWVLRGFTTATVFDISQTDGEDLDEIRPALLEGEAPAGLYAALAEMVNAQGFELVNCWSEQASEDTIGSANGRTDFGARTVTLRYGLSDAQRTKTLAHELGHILCGHESELFGGCRGRLEVEAESVAYIVCQATGMVTDGYSLPYLATWAAGDLEKVRQTAEKVVKVAGSILEQVETAREAVAA